MFYAICNWGNENVTQWAPAMAQSWRTTVDVSYGEQTNSFYQIQANFINNQKVRASAGPGGWNDPDMLLMGYAADMTEEQMKTQFALWAFAKAPLILSADIAKLGNVTDTGSIASMLNNPALIAVNQDSLGNQCEEIDAPDSTGTGDSLGYYKALIEDKTTQELYTALLIVNWYDDNLQANTVLNLSEHGIALSQYDNCEITDLWSGAKTQGMGGDTEFQTTGLAKHSHMAYKIKCSAF